MLSERVVAAIRASRGAVLLFERMVWVFPVAVVVLTAVALLCGGRVSAWQWWVPVAGVFAAAAWGRRMRRERALACGLFAALLAGIWVWAGVCVRGVGVDNIAYHLPATRLLIEGWNPVQASTPGAIAAAMGVEPWEMRLWHVLSVPRTVWLFHAVAYGFTKAPFGLLVTLWPFLFIAAAGQVWRLARPASWGGAGLRGGDAVGFSA